MNVYFDTTKSLNTSHQSGLSRLSRRLVREMSRLLVEGGHRLTMVLWDSANRRWISRSGENVVLSQNDWLLTPELFSEEERPGFIEFLKNPGCQTAAVFHDAIPLKFPNITWPKSVRRHPCYMMLLLEFDRVFAVSEASKVELLSYWKWLAAAEAPEVSVISLGADIGGLSRVKEIMLPPLPMRLMVLGIVEPRKNQLCIAEASVKLWEKGLKFHLHIIGRPNPHFSAPILKRFDQIESKWKYFKYEGEMGDSNVEKLSGECVFLASASIAEGNGLPVLESMWHGVPCILSPIPSFIEHARGGGCVIVPENTVESWSNALEQHLKSRELLESLRIEAGRRPLTRWTDTSAQILSKL